MKKITLTLPLLPLLVACGGGSDKTVDQEMDSLLQREPLVLNLSSVDSAAIPVDCSYEGKLSYAFTWDDDNGKNYLIASEGDIESTNIEGENGLIPSSCSFYVYQYFTKPDAPVVKVRDLTETVKDCEFDIIVKHMAESVQITDLDNDRIAEVYFVYQYTCTSDVSPLDMKLTMWQNGTGYELIGYTEMDGLGGEITDSTDFNEAPAGCFDEAKKLWNTFKTK